MTLNPARKGSLYFDSARFKRNPVLCLRSQVKAIMRFCLFEEILFAGERNKLSLPLLLLLLLQLLQHSCASAEILKIWESKLCCKIFNLGWKILHFHAVMGKLFNYSFDCGFVSLYLPSRGFHVAKELIFGGGIRTSNPSSVKCYF